MKGVKSLDTIAPQISHLDLETKINFVSVFKNAVEKVDADNEKNYYGITNVSNKNGFTLQAFYQSKDYCLKQRKLFGFQVLIILVQ